MQQSSQHIYHICNRVWLGYSSGWWYFIIYRKSQTRLRHGLSPLLLMHTLPANFVTRCLREFHVPATDHASWICPFTRAGSDGGWPIGASLELPGLLSAPGDGASSDAAMVGWLIGIDSLHCSLVGGRIWRETMMLLSEDGGRTGGMGYGDALWVGMKIGSLAFWPVCQLYIWSNCKNYQQMMLKILLTLQIVEPPCQICSHICSWNLCNLPWKQQK